MMRHLYMLELPARAPRRLIGCWLALAVAALGVSAICAIVLVIARTPFAGALLSDADTFRAALVLHVNFATVIWFMSFAAMLWTALGADKATGAHWAAFILALAGSIAIGVAPLVARGPALLGNYVPVIDNPVFLAGLSWFATGIALLIVLALTGRRMLMVDAGPERALRHGIYLALCPTIVAGGSLIFSALTGPAPVVAATWFENSFWGAGHALQFTHVLLMMSVWLVLAGESDLVLPVSPRWLSLLFVAAVVPVAAIPVMHFMFPADSIAFRGAVSHVMSYGAWPAAAMLGMIITVALWRERKSGADNTGTRIALGLSIGLFFAGCAVGAAIRENNTMIPAHYHGTIGAVTLAYMALTLKWLPRLGIAVTPSRLATLQPAIYGSGLMLLVLGLAWSGGHGAARKAPWVHADGVSIDMMAAGIVGGTGGAIAITGCIMFVMLVVRAVTHNRRSMRSRVAHASRRPMRDARARALIITLATVAGGGTLLGWYQGALPGLSNPLLTASDAAIVPRHAGAQRDKIAREFALGVAFLQNDQYAEAAAAFHRVLQTTPDVPEAHANMGFALIGMKQYAAARDFFESATALRRDQVNAYYGLAVALDELGDRPGAVGAMRTYIHLSPADDPYLRKAQSALWEWEAALDAQRSSAGAQGRGIPTQQQNSMRERSR
jgi:cytochrome c oxidase subunit I